MKLKLSELKKYISVLLSEGGETAVLQKYKFIKPDTLQMLNQAIWRYSADVASEKAAKNKKLDPNATNVDQNIGEVKPSKDEVMKIVQDAALSISTAIDDLTKHFIGAEKQIKAPPPRRSSDTGNRGPITKQ